MFSTIGRLLAAAAVMASLSLPGQSFAQDAAVATEKAGVDADAAQVLARREGCLKCHGVEKDKEGPSFKRLAAKYKDKDKAETEARFIEHLRTGPVVKFSDGEEEDHRIIRSTDENAVMNLIRWILSR